jgi:penicillin-binding protein 1A
VARVIVRIARQALLVVLFAGAALLGSVSGVLFVYGGDLPQISALDNYEPNTITRILSADGRVVGEFATERRVVIGYDDMSPRLRQAIIASEDQEFEKHVGLSVPRIVIALVKDILERRKASGASTLTQQLARNLFLTFEKTWERKIKEAILAIQIEKRYTKREIFALYANQIYFGHGAYGVEAASRIYFNKPARDLVLEEAAIIAGIIQSPSRQSPYVNVDAAMRRRNYALTRMADAGYISASEAAAARKRPIVTAGLPTDANAVAPFFVEEVRKHLEAAYGAKRLYENGLTVRTSMDIALQTASSEALVNGLRALDKRRGFRKAARNIVAEGGDLQRFDLPRWHQPVRPSQIVPAAVTSVDAAQIGVRVGALRGAIDRKGFVWARKPATALVSVGDLIEVKVDALDEDGSSFAASLEQTPQAEGAVLAIENRTGQILAMVGGYSFDRSKFNRAVQAYRQVGSTFKPFVYTVAIDRGFTPTTILSDTPATYASGPGQPAYSPTNYDHKWEGPITLRRAFEQSRNVPAVRMMDTLGPAQVTAYARRFGFLSPMQPYLSTALGACEATLLELTSAFSVFPNQGVRMTPHLVLKVTDREGNSLEENRPEPTDAIRADTAYVMTHLLEGVVVRGTAARAASLDWPLGGKTGTTDDFTDAWFVGFDPDITVGVWIGHDQKRPLGPSESGAVAALPIWMDVMKAWIASRPARPAFAPPGNVVFVSVDRSTGATIDGAAPGAISEAFISGTQPGGGLRPQP